MYLSEDSICTLSYNFLKAYDIRPEVFDNIQKSFSEQYCATRNCALQTPLMSAVLEGKTQSARILIISGADIDIPEKVHVHFVIQGTS